MMKPAIIVFECPGSSPCNAPRRIAVGIKTQAGDAPGCKREDRSAINKDYTPYPLNSSSYFFGGARPFSAYSPIHGCLTHPSSQRRRQTRLAHPAAEGGWTGTGH